MGKQRGLIERLLRELGGGTGADGQPVCIVGPNLFSAPRPKKQTKDHYGAPAFMLYSVGGAALTATAASNRPCVVNGVHNITAGALTLQAQLFGAGSINPVVVNGTVTNFTWQVTFNNTVAAGLYLVQLDLLMSGSPTAPSITFALTLN